jgi:predicted phosphoribosyltransferase
MTFKDRREAARLLAARLVSYRGRGPLVLGIPRGGLLVAAAVSEALEGDLDVALVRKIGLPGNPELAIGAVAETGEVFFDDHPFLVASASEGYRRWAVEQALILLRRRRESYTPHRSPIDPAGREVLLIDDGVATGSTLMAALRALEARKAARRVAAAPVAPGGARKAFARLADDVVFLHEPEEFRAVSQFYEDFPEVRDDEVVAALAAARPSRRAG